MDHKTAERVDEVDALRLENLTLKVQAAVRERDAFGASLNVKYGAEHGLNIAADGSIERIKAPEPPEAT